MTIYLKKLRLYRVVTIVEQKLLLEKSKWYNKCDEAYGTLYMAISEDLLFVEIMIE